jgi:hypothetical protein
VCRCRHGEDFATKEREETEEAVENRRGQKLFLPYI